MKLHAIELENLGSLYGRHQIDLGRDLGGAPLFMILGPTGAGKSTILDAICLALFGQTPRLVQRRGQSHTDSRLIMSQGSGECFARVEFSRPGASGRERFRAEWRCRRARLHPDGRLQSAERTLEWLDEHRRPRRSLEGRASQADLALAFEEALGGLDVEGFKRSMLLAQGQFAAFIRASEGERAMILERLTRTDVFKRIGQSAAARAKETEALRKSVEAEAKASEMMGVEALASLRDQHKTAEAAVETARRDLSSARSHESWWSRRLLLGNRETAARTALQTAQEQIRGQKEAFERLEEDTRCRSAEVLLRTFEKLSSERERLQHQVKELDTAQRGQAGQAEQAKVAVAEAAAVKATQQKASDDARVTLHEARALRQAVRKAEDEARLARFALAEAAEEDREARRAAEDAEKGLFEALERRDKRHKQAEKAQHIEPLTRELEGLKERHLNLSRYAGQLQQRHARRDEDRAALQGLQRDTALVKAQLDEAVRALEPFVDARREAIDRLKGALDGAEDAEVARQSLAAALTNIRDRRSALAEVHRLGRRLSESDAEHDKDALQADRLDAEIQAHDALRTAGHEAVESAVADVETRREHHLDLKMAVSLSQHRARLKPGRPCPLCGSEEHPYTSEADLKSQDERLERRCEEIAAQFSQARAQLDRVRREASDLDAQAARLDASRLSLTERMEARQKRRANIEGLLRSSLESASLSPDAGVEAIETASGALDSQMTRLQKALQDLDAGQSLLQSCDQTLSEGDKAVEALGSSLQVLQSRLDDHGKQVERHNEEIAALTREVDEVTESLTRSLAACYIKIPEIEPGQPDIGAAMDEATRLMGIFMDRTNALGVAQTQCDEASTQRDAAKLRAEAAERRLTERRDAFEARQKAIDTLQEKLAAHPFGDHPARHELAFEVAIQDADARLTEVTREAEAIAQRSARTSALFEESADRLASVELQLREHRQSISEQIGELDITDLRALSGALLSPMERQKLEAERRRVLQALDKAEASLSLVQEERDSHDEARPEGMAILSMSSESLAMACAEAEARLNTASTDLDKIRAEVEEQERLAEGREGLQKRLIEVSRESARWRKLADLIGKGDGESFRRFAQSLNLQVLLQRANTHLERLEPRYRLAITLDAKGLPELDFVVRDAHNTGRSRPLTTLSGGETFLVSLALALALSDRHTAHAPIETLLLDEGVGTLDRDALDTAMNALERLHGQGTQIGIISHLDSLTERIPARIVVEKLGGGRSALRFETTSPTGG